MGGGGGFWVVVGGFWVVVGGCWLVVGGWWLKKSFTFLSFLREVAYILLPQAQQQPFLVSKLVEANILEVLNGYCESILHRLVALAPQGGDVGGEPQALHQLLNCLKQAKNQTLLLILLSLLLLTSTTTTTTTTTSATGKESSLC